ncbi:MAG: hypothetical protein Ct9H300mP11_21450 [Chloroflexota bacterium]|nr:MAG: hypothetical protein Ct9H300mP11_21450 [Chloroflexota bacterium]
MPWISPTPGLGSEEWERARKVREALAISVDRQSIIDTLMRGFAKPIPLWLFGAFGQPHLDGRLWDYDPDRAKTLLEEAGYGDGFSITLTPSLRGAPAEVEACEVIAQMWEDIGLEFSSRNYRIRPSGRLWLPGHTREPHVTQQAPG